MGFGDDAIAVISSGMLRATGSFAERLVSRGLIGDIVSGSAILAKVTRIFDDLCDFFRNQ